jgi:hypothetical protein
MMGGEALEEIVESPSLPSPSLPLCGDLAIKP